MTAFIYLLNESEDARSNKDPEISHIRIAEQYLDRVSIQQ